MDEDNSLRNSYISTFAENCSIAVGHIIRLLLGRLEYILNDCEDDCDDVNLEHKNLIENQYYKLLDEIEDGVRLFLDCNSSHIQSFSIDNLKGVLFHVNEQLEKVNTQLTDIQLNANIEEYAPVCEKLSTEQQINIRLSGGEIDTYEDKQGISSREEADESFGQCEDADLSPLVKKELPEENGFNPRRTSRKRKPTAKVEISPDKLGNSGRLKSQRRAKRRKPYDIDSTDYESEQNESETAQRCSKCDASFPTSKSLRRHMNIHKVINCDICGEEVEKRLMPNHIELGHPTNETENHICSACDASFTTMKALTAHQKTHKEVKCDFCDLIFKKSELSNHVKTHFTCSNCQMDFSSQQKLDEHAVSNTCVALESGYENEPFFMCKVCKVDYGNSESLKAHMRSHLPKVPCPHCSKEVNKKNLTRHIEVKHFYVKVDGEKKHHCQHCPVSFTQKLSYEKHIMGNHPDTPEGKELSETKEREKFKCKACNKIFSTTEEHDAHKQQCSEKPYKCGVCSNTYDTKSGLMRHKFVHAKKEVRCQHCGKHFRKEYDLRIHVMRRHENNRPFKCEYCFKGFVTNRELQNHLYTHTGVSEHQCHLCQKFFNNGVHMRRHIEQVHIRLHRFVCDLCGEAFITARKLHNHQMRHKDNKPYKCTQCDKCFSWESGLSQHVREIHENKSASKKKPRKKGPKIETEEIIHGDLIQVYQPGSEEIVSELSAHEVAAAAESVEIQSVVYDAQNVVDESIVYNVNAAADEFVYYQTEQGEVQTGQLQQYGDNDIQFVIYTSQ